MSAIQFQHITTIPGQPKWMDVSPDGRWLCLNHGKEWAVYDALSGQLMHSFVLHDQSWCVIAPNGKAIATMNRQQIIVVMSDGQRITLDYRQPDDVNSSFYVCFSADSQHLWATLNDNYNAGHIALLDVQTLKILDIIPKPIYDTDLHKMGMTDWCGPDMTVHLPTDTLAVAESCGDNFYGIYFFKHQNQRIQVLPFHVDDVDDDIRSLGKGCFSTDGTRYAAFDSAFLWTWQLPEMVIIGNGYGNSLHEDIGEEDADADITPLAVGFLGKDAIVAASNCDDDITHLLLLDGLQDKRIAKIELPQSFTSDIIGAYPIMIGESTFVAVDETTTTIYRMTYKILP